MTRPDDGNRPGVRGPLLPRRRTGEPSVGEKVPVESHPVNDIASRVGHPRAEGAGRTGTLPRTLAGPERDPQRRTAGANGFRDQRETGAVGNPILTSHANIRHHFRHLFPSLCPTPVTHLLACLILVSFVWTLSDHYRYHENEGPETPRAPGRGRRSCHACASAQGQRETQALSGIRRPPMAAVTCAAGATRQKEWGATPSVCGVWMGCAGPRAGGQEQSQEVEPRLHSGCKGLSCSVSPIVRCESRVRASIIV